MDTPKGIGRTLRRSAPWLAGAALVLAGTGLAMRHAARTQLEADASQVALQWAAFARDTVPDLEQALAGRGFTPEAVVQLCRLSQAGGVFRFQLFDAQGHRLVTSEDLEKGITASAPSMLGAQEDGDDPALRQAVLGGSTHVQLKRDGGAGRPAVFSEAYVPVTRSGRLLGAVEVYVDQSGHAARVEAAFREVALAVAALLCTLGGGLAWQWRQRDRRERSAQERARYLAQHDVLTGTLNRSRFGEALERAQARAAGGGKAFAVLCVDIHGFKDVNESLGHAAGDDLLRAVARRLRETVHHADPVARLGGDEFAVLQAALDDPEEVSRLGQRIVDALSKPFAIAGQPLHVVASVGAAVYGNDGQEADALLHKADQALRRAKQQRRASFSFYDAALDQRLQDQREIVRDLRQALYAGELHLNFQPLYERDGRTLGGYEALVRWHHPKRGPVSPGEFIPLAEEHGLIDDLGMWVLARACEVAATWPPSLTLSVNLSAVQFRRGDELVGLVGACLQAAGVPAHRLELEITESLLMNNTEAVVQTLHRLTEMGVRIVMDDFGTGYSSLAYLWRFPFDKVKIDRAFTQHLGQDPKVDLIVRSIVSLAHSLNIRVNAEGVETPAQLRCLQEHGCDELQGFLLGKPSPAAQLRHDGAPKAATEPRLPRAMTDFAPFTS